MTRTPLFFALLLTALLTVSCGRQVKPQAPANLPREDSAALAAMFANYRLAEEADRNCALFVQQADTAYVLSDFHFWYALTRRNNAPLLQPGDHVEIFYTASTFSGTLLQDVQIQIEVGHRDVPEAIDLLLTEMAPGQQARIITPYYLAYGREGNANVPPLTNCIICISEIKRL